MDYWIFLPYFGHFIADRSEQVSATTATQAVPHVETSLIQGGAAARSEVSSGASEARMQVAVARQQTPMPILQSTEEGSMILEQSSARPATPHTGVSPPWSAVYEVTPSTSGLQPNQPPSPLPGFSTGTEAPQGSGVLPSLPAVPGDIPLAPSSHSSQPPPPPSGSSSGTVAPQETGVWPSSSTVSGVIPLAPSSHYNQPPLFPPGSSSGTAAPQESGVQLSLPPASGVIPSASGSQSRQPLPPPPEPSSSPSAPLESGVWPSSSAVSGVIPLAPGSHPSQPPPSPPGSSSGTAALQESGVQPPFSTVPGVRPLAPGSDSSQLPPPPPESSSSTPAAPQSGVRPSLSAVSVVIPSRPRTRAEQSEPQAAPPPNEPSSRTLTSVRRSQRGSVSGSGSGLQSTASSSRHVPTRRTTESVQSQSTDPEADELSQPEPPSKRRRHTEIIRSELTKPPPRELFKLTLDWIRNTPVLHALLKDGFYTSTDVAQFGLPGCPKAILDELNLYPKFTSWSEGTRLDNCYHSVLQQALVQNPHVYLAALAAMRTENHRMTSLPVAPLIFRPRQDSELQDPTFPFEKFIANERRVSATRLLFSVGKVDIGIAQGSRSRQEVKAWWEACNGNLEEAADRLKFNTVQLEAGEFVVCEPQQPWCLYSSDPQSSPGPHKYIVIVEVRYIAVNPNLQPDFNYWDDGTFDDISGPNRDLKAPTVTGWGAASEGENVGKRFPAAVEMRGVWYIGDALLGLISWNSHLVQEELHELFKTSDGGWYNKQFVEMVEEKLDTKLESVMSTLKSACEPFL